MRALIVVGVILVVLGTVALAVPSFTYFTTERAADLGFFKIDISRPHTVILNPIAGAAALVAGIVLLIMGRRSASP
ncbi:MAG: hypothetical protein ACYC6N_00900 [Pirellulaceae bacterium]